MTVLERPLCDSEVARSNLSREIERLGDVVQDLEARLQQVTLPGNTMTCQTGEAVPKLSARSQLADEIHNRADRVAAIADRLISLRNSIDL